MKKVLIIEDDQIVANIYRNRLSVEGYNVEIALDGEAGRDLIRSFRPDAIVLDLMLPKVTGVELIRQIRAEPEFEEVPVIVFSNTYLTNMVQEAWKAGATKCLSKANCTPRHVLEVLGSVLGKNGDQTASARIPPPVRPSRPVPPEPPAPAPALQVEVSEPFDSDAEFQADLRRSFLEGLPRTLGTLRTLLQGIVKADGEATRLKQIHEMYRRIHALTGNAGIAGMFVISQMADAFEALLKELHDKPRNINASTLRTVALAVDFLGVLFDHGARANRQEISPACILVVDDEAISRRAVTYALEKAKLKSVSVEDPNAAYQMLLERKFDLVFLDVDMPGMNGFELCSRLRALPIYKDTPVVFVTSLTDFDSRANSMMSGGNDFIAKPFLFIELAVKALVYVLREKLGYAAKAAF